MSQEMVAQCLSPAIRAHVLGGEVCPEHRAVTIAFIRFEGTDALIERAVRRPRPRRCIAW